MHGTLLYVFSILVSTRAFFLVDHSNILTTQRIDPIVDPSQVGGHVHTVVGGSNFALSTETDSLRESDCTTNPIKEDKSNYWFPTLYFQWKNGSFSSVDGGVVTYYLFDDKNTSAFPDNFRMVSGNPTIRSYKNNSAAQAVTFLCLDFNSKNPAPRFNSLPPKKCPSGIRAQINFPSCWNGRDLDSDDHQSHVSFRSTGPDTGSCTDPKFPVSIPRIFMEFYTQTATWDALRSQALNPDQPYVYSTGDPTGFGYHADFINGWDTDVLQNIVNKCDCSTAAPNFGDPKCCADLGVIQLQPSGSSCKITDSVEEQTLGTIPILPGNNPVRTNDPSPLLKASSTPAIVGPVKVYTSGAAPNDAGTKVLTPASSSPGAAAVPSAGSNKPETASVSIGGADYGYDGGASTAVLAAASAPAVVNGKCWNASKRRVRRSASNTNQKMRHQRKASVVDGIF